MNDFAGKFDLLVMTLPLTFLPSLLAIIVAIWSTRKTILTRNYWLCALVLTLIGLGISILTLKVQGGGSLTLEIDIYTLPHTSNEIWTFIPDSYILEFNFYIDINI